VDAGPLGMRSLVLLHPLPRPRVDGLSRDSGLESDGERVRLFVPHPLSLSFGRSLSLNTGETGLDLGDRLVRRLGGGNGGGAQRSERDIEFEAIGGGSIGFRTGETTSPSSRSKSPSGVISGLMSVGRSICLDGTEDDPLLCHDPFLVSTGLDDPRIDRGARGGRTFGVDWD
jgi:hypothetical protein